MLKYDKLFQWAKQAGFESVGLLKVKDIDLKPEVRAMCASNSCKRYGTNWSCPPGCGSLEQCERRIRQYSEGILVQTVGELEDEFDGKAMIETENIHKANFLSFAKILRKHYPDLLALGSGCCMHCEKCTYPNAPCRFPNEKIDSMEAYGILVHEICQKSGLKYYYGSCRIAYTGCYMLF